MNIFQYFEASGSSVYTDFDHRVTYFHRDGGCEIVPWDKSYKRWISYSLLNFVPSSIKMIADSYGVPQRNIGSYESATFNG